MKPLDRMIEASTEFVCEQWGRGEARLMFYAPVTREGDAVWIHPTWARQFPWEEITARATRIWRVRGSLWNPQEYSLIWTRGDRRSVVGSVGEPGQEPATVACSILELEELEAAA